MATIMDYIAWRGDLPFSSSEFSDVDALIFTQLSYIDFSGAVSSDMKECVTLKQAAKKVLAEGERPLGAVLPEDITELLKAAAASRRFCDIGLSGFVNRIDIENEEQFSAVLFHIGRSIFVAYRGTDDTIVGWKEDFNLSYMDSVPAQREAAEYLNKAMRAYRFVPFFAGGHSKGGNLSVYAAANLSPRHKRRIKKVFNFDGPGFPEELIKTPEYEEIGGKVINILPEGSIVGRLFSACGKEKIVSCKENLIMQHVAFGWQVLGGAFVTADGPNGGSVAVDRVLSGWIADMTNQEREALVEALFEVFKSSEAKTLTDIINDKLGFMKAIGGVSKDKKRDIRKYMAKILEQAAKYMIKN